MTAVAGGPAGHTALSTQEDDETMKTLNSRKTLAAAAGLFALLMAGAASADVKIATIRVGDVVQQSPQFKAGADKIKAEFDRRKNELEADMKKFQADAAKYQKEGQLMSPADQAKTEKDLTARQVDLQYKQRQFQEDFQNRDRQLTGDMMNQIRGVIEKVAKEKGVDAVLQDPVYATDAVDITDDVLKRLQASAPAAGK
ncbi:MAG: OmpH family outer membrane protein [Nevskiaceae bacterium]|nr:MAG: OmpH family outer membrane protein [Nevskiaceae bacterium]